MTHHPRRGHAVILSVLLACALSLVSSASLRAGDDCNLAEPRPLVSGVDQAAQQFFAGIAGGGVGRVMIVGDSISYRANSYNWYLRDHLHAQLGNAGEGYFGIGAGFSKTPNANHARPGQLLREFDLSPHNNPFDPAGTGNIIFSNINTGRTVPWGGWTPDGIYTHMTGPGAIELDFYGTSATLHYLRTPSGGKMRLTCNGVDLGVFHTAAPFDPPPAPFTINRAPGAGPIVQYPMLTEAQFAQRVRHESFTFETGAPDNDTINTLRIEWVSGGRIQLNGIEMRSGQPGAAYSRVARGGQGPRDFLLSANKVVAAQLMEQNPDLLIVMLDWSTFAERETFEEDTNALLDFYRKAMPGTPVILMTHHPFIADMELEADIYRKIACERSLGYINLYDLFTGWSQMASLGFMVDSVHFSATGGAWFGSYVFGVLTATAP